VVLHLYGFYRPGLIRLGKLIVARSIVGSMNTTIFRTRQMSLALLVVGVIDHGSLNIDYSGGAPTSSGLVRLGRDLMPRSGAAVQTTRCQPPLY
jgi:hypothetical protein